MRCNIQLHGSYPVHARARPGQYHAGVLMRFDELEVEASPCRASTMSRRLATQNLCLRAHLQLQEIQEIMAEAVVTSSMRLT
jgi:hypothetical protein